ncbi:MAG: hypothetical protein RL095_3570 [Verrucomicrobiota bacterium]|jgi:hypothetical protein
MTKLLAALGLLTLSACAQPQQTEVPAPKTAAAPPEPVKVNLLPGEPGLADLARAREVLRNWEETDAQKGERLLRIVYWTPADRDPLPDFQARLSRVLKHIQAFYAAEMDSYGFPGRSIKLEEDSPGQVKITVAKGRLLSQDCSEEDHSDGDAIRKDCIEALKAQGIDGGKDTLVIFCNLSEWDPEKRRMSHHSPYYASGDSRGGTAWQLDSVLLDPLHLGVQDQFLHDRQYGRISLGKYNSIFIGGVCHELGHALGLPHCKECAGCRAARGTALMGSGNRTYGEELRGESQGSFLSLPHALKLAGHPQFSGSIKQMQTRVMAEFSEWKMESRPEGLRVAAKVAANLPLTAVIAYADPAGNGDYDSEIAAAVPLADGSFSLLLPHPEGRRNADAELHFVAVAANGAATASVWSDQAFSLPARVDDQGHLDVSQALASLEFEAAWKLKKAGRLDPSEVSALSPRLQETFRRLAQPDSAAGKPKPSEASVEIKTLALSDAAPDTARTGYGGVHFDRKPDGSPLIGSGGLAKHGLYAHANAEHGYDLGGAWTSFSGRVGILQGGYGKVRFSLWADGKQIWKSGLVKEGSDKAFSVKVEGVRQLVLRAEAEDNRGAWSAWLDPELKR